MNGPTAGQTPTLRPRLDPASGQATPAQLSAQPAQPAQAARPAPVERPMFVSQLAPADRAAAAATQAPRAPAARAEPDPPSTDRRGFNQPTERMIGRVTFCSGSRATISTSANELTGASADFWAVGRLISIDVGKARVVALVFEMKTDLQSWNDRDMNAVSVFCELVGEVHDGLGGMPVFKRGVTRYPPLGAVAHRIRARDLECMHDLGQRTSVEIGALSQNEDIPATVSVEDMLRRHFAVVGTTGVGKSCAVSLLVRKCLEVKQNLRVMMLDPHNEFAHAFGDQAQSFDVASLNLPFWLFRFEELEDVVFRGRPEENEADILRELVALARAHYREGGAAGAVRRSADTNGFTADSPTPYRMADVLKQIDDALGQLEPRWSRAWLRSLRSRIESLLNDPRYVFMFGRGAVEDNMGEVLAKLFRLPDHGRPISIVNMSGLPSDVMNAVVSVLARLAFDVAYASDGALQVLLVCEEAHRYVPHDPSLGFRPTRRAIAKIAKEGRKYGASIAVVTQRPGELDPTILSQCSTVFAMRLANDRDQEIIRSAISDSSASTISFLSALDTREAIAFGEGVATPMRLKFAAQPAHLLPQAANLDPASATGFNPAAGADWLVRRLRSEQAPPPTPAAAPTPVAVSSLRAPAAPGSIAASSLLRRPIQP